MLVKFYQSLPQNPKILKILKILIQTFSMPMLVKFYPENPENPENPDSDKLELKCVTSVIKNKFPISKGLFGTLQVPRYAILCNLI